MSSLHDKLYNCEQNPPSKVWDKIAAALDESHLDDEFPSKLYNAEATVPGDAWEKIATALEPGNVPVAPMARKNFTFFRYAAAAILIGLVSLGVIKWMNRSNDKGDVAIARVDSSSKQKASGNPNENGEALVDNGKENITPEKTTNDVLDVTTVRPSSAKKAKSNYSIGDNTDAIEPIYAYNDNAPRLADRYIMYMTPDGGIVRMSKKWGNLVCCVSGQEQDEDCKDQIKKWQEKLACAPVATSNFGDILSLVSTLNNTEL
jgi:hypothetical protein